MCAYFWTLSNSPNRNTDADLIGCYFPLFWAAAVYLLTTCAKMVWLMGMRSMLSICLTSLRHIGHLTLRFLGGRKVTYRTFWGRECRRCVRSVSWCEVDVRWCRMFFCREDSYPCLGVYWRISRFICDRDLAGFLLVWRRKSLGFQAFSFNSK